MKPILTGKEYLALPRDINTWLIEPLLPAGGVGIVYGDPKVGKSFAVLQLALALNSGTDWMGFPLRAARSVYIQLDTPRSLWAERLEKLLAAGFQGIEELLLADRETLNTWPFDILRPDHQDILKTYLTPLKPDLVIIDTLRESHSAEENDSTAMKEVISSLVSATHPAALLLIHHSKKPQPDREGQITPDLINDLRGGYVAGAMDAILKFSKRGLHYVGRATEQGTVQAERDGDLGFWTPVLSDLDAWLDTVVADPDLKTLGQKADSLAMLTGRSVEMCRAAIRRRLSAHPAPDPLPSGEQSPGLDPQPSSSLPLLT